MKSDVLEGHLKLFTCDYVMLHASGVNTSVVPFADLIVLLRITSIFGPQYLFYFFLNLNLVCFLSLRLRASALRIRRPYQAGRPSTLDPRLPSSIGHCEAIYTFFSERPPGLTPPTMSHAVPDLDAIGIKADHDLADQFRREVANLLSRNNLNSPVLSQSASRQSTLPSCSAKIIMSAKRLTAFAA